MAKLTFEQLQSRLLKVAKEVYGYDSFPRFHLLNKAHGGDEWSLCGRKDFNSHSTCDGHECVEPQMSGDRICWRLYRFQQPEFWAGCAWLRLDDAFDQLVRHQKMLTCSGYEMFRIAPRVLNAKYNDAQKSLWDDEAGEAPAPRVDVVVSRIIRDSPAAKGLKELYGDHCQVCGLGLCLGASTYYSEAHHLRPLGAPHNGPDEWSNMLVLCPNHHTLFDYGIPTWHDEKTLEIEGILFTLQQRHTLSANNIGYYKQHLQLEPRI